MIDTATRLSRGGTLGQERVDSTLAVIFLQPFQMFLMTYLEIFEVGKITDSEPQEVRIFDITSISA